MLIHDPVHNDPCLTVGTRHIDSLPVDASPASMHIAGVPSIVVDCMRERCMPRRRLDDDARGAARDARAACSTTQRSGGASADPGRTYFARFKQRR